MSLRCGCLPGPPAPVNAPTLNSIEEAEKNELYKPATNELRRVRQ